MLLIKRPHQAFAGFSYKKFLRWIQAEGDLAKAAFSQRYILDIKIYINLPNLELFWSNGTYQNPEETCKIVCTKSFNERYTPKLIMEITSFLPIPLGASIALL